MKHAVLWDSSAVLALLDADDADHRAATLIAHEIIWLGISANEAARQSASAADAMRSIESARELREVMPLLEIPSEEGNWSMEVADRYNAGWREATISFKKLHNRVTVRRGSCSL